MRDIDDQRRTIFVRKLLERPDIGRVRIHREQALGDQQDAVLGVGLRGSWPASRARLDQVVAEQVDVAGRGLGALLEAGMAERVHDDMVVAAHQPLTTPKPAAQPVGDKATCS